MVHSIDFIMEYDFSQYSTEKLGLFIVFSEKLQITNLHMRWCVGM